MNINHALGIEVIESEEWQTSLSNNSHLIQLELEWLSHLLSSVSLRSHQPS